MSGSRDFLLRITTPSGTSASIEQFRLISHARTSIADYDTSMQGLGDATIAPLEADPDHDTVPALLDVDPQVPNLIPAIHLDLRLAGQRELRVSLSNDVGLPIASMGHSTWFQKEPRMGSVQASNGWRTWPVDLGDSEGDLSVVFNAAKGGTLTLKVFRQGTTITGLQAAFNQGPYEVLQQWPVIAVGPQDMQLLVLGLDMHGVLDDVGDIYALIKKGVKAIPWMFAQEFVVDAMVARIQSQGSQQVMAKNMLAGSSASIRAPWTGPDGSPKESMVLGNYPDRYPGVTMVEVRSFLQTSPTPYKGAPGSLRWFRETGGQLLMLESDELGNFLGGAKVPITTLADVAERPYVVNDQQTVEDLYSVERAVADQLYGLSGTYSSLACHLTCHRIRTVGTHIGVDPGFIPEKEGLATRGFWVWGMDKGLRLSERQGSTAVPWNHLMAKNTLGLESMLYIKRLALDSTGVTSAAFEAHWGKRQGNENCQTDTRARRCTDPSLTSLLGGTTNGIEPFKVKWTQLDQGFETEAVAIDGAFNPFPGWEPQAGQSRLEQLSVGSEAALGQMNPSTSSEAVVSIDLTNLNQAFVYGQEGALGRFRHDYS